MVGAVNLVDRHVISRFITYSIVVYWETTRKKISLLFSFNVTDGRTCDKLSAQGSLLTWPYLSQNIRKSRK